MSRLTYGVYVLHWLFWTVLYSCIPRTSLHLALGVGGSNFVTANEASIEHQYSVFYLQTDVSSLDGRSFYYRIATLK